MSPDELTGLPSQARKYGLGLLFATQSPQALHNSPKAADSSRSAPRCA